MDRKPTYEALQQRINELEQESSERKRAQERIEHLKTALHAIRDVDRLITSERDRNSLLQRACETLVKNRGYYNAWIALLDEEGRLVGTAEAGLGRAFLPMIQRLGQGQFTECGRKALAESAVIVIPDPMSSCIDCPLSYAYGGRGAITVRLEYGESVYGLFSASIPSDFATDEEEQALFKEVSDDIALALYNIELEEQSKRAEEALRESEARLKAIFEAAQNVAFIMTDLAGTDAHILEFSPGAEQLFGYTREQAIGKPVAMLHLPEDVAKFPEVIEQMRHHKGGFSGESTLIRKSGEPFPALFTTHPILDAGGNMTAALGVSIDITKRKRAEEHIRALSQELMKAQETERQMISRELHDSVAQELSMVKIGCDTLFDNHPDVPPEIKAKVSELSAVLQNSIMAVRDLSYDLRPPGLDQLGLAQTIFEHCERFSKRTGLTVDFTSAGMNGLRLSPNVEINLYRLIQEALNNIQKHANASHVTVRLVAAHPSIILRIGDDGIGFDVKKRMAAAADEKRMGLRSMEERVNLLGGTMKIRSRSTQGTKISIRIPNRER